MNRQQHERGGFDEASFEHLPLVEEDSFWFRSRNALIVWAMRRHFPTAQSFLEVGCGTGYVLAGLRAAFPELRLVGGEIHAAGLEVAAHRVPDASLLRLDARELPYVDEFDAAGAFDVLEHVPEDVDALAELHRALRRDGGLLLTVPQHPRLWSPVDEYARHVRRYTRQELRTKLERAGFDVIRATSFVSLLVPLLAVSRFRQTRSARFDPLEEYRMSPFVDSTLGWVMRAERTLIRAGLSFPLGGSLLVVAKRR